jgi:hypothetical protein
VPKPNPGRPGDDKNETGKNERYSFYYKQFHFGTYAYVHVLPGIISPQFFLIFNLITVPLLWRDISIRKSYYINI